MMDFVKAMASASSGMRAQGARLRVATENLANVDSGGYRRKTVSFDDAMDRATGARTVTIDNIGTDRSPLQRRYEPAHPNADGDGYVLGSNVNLMTEVADAREARRSYEANVRMFDQTRRMYGQVLDLLRR